MDDPTMRWIFVKGGDSLEGIFIRKKFNVWLLCGIFSIGLYVLFNIVDPKATNKSVVFLFLGMLELSASFLSLLWNRGAFFHISDNSVKIKYHLFGKIDCRLSDVEFVSAKTNTLIIQLKSGKCRTISGIKNPWELCREMRRKMSFEPAKSKKSLLKSLAN